MSDLEVQKRLWGRDGHGIPGANPHHAGRAGIVALVIVIIFAIGFVTLTDHSPKMPDMRYYDLFSSDVANSDALQTQLPQALHDSPKKSSFIVRHLAATLVTEDRLLQTARWPLRVRGEVASFVRINQQQIAVLTQYLSASTSKRNGVLWRQISVSDHALSYDTTIKIDLNRIESSG